MKCRKHPKYQAKRKPKVACEACWILYFDKLRATEYGCEFCSFRPTSNSDFCNRHRPCPDLVIK